MRNQQQSGSMSILACLTTLLALMLLSACAGQTSSTRSATPTHTPTAMGASSAGAHAGEALYTDAKLGFRLWLPSGWVALPQPGRFSSTRNTSVVLMDSNDPKQQAQVSVIEGTDMPAAFAQVTQTFGADARHEWIGAYPALVLDTTVAQGRVPCLARELLATGVRGAAADADDVIADWCASDAATHVTAFERLLASYAPALPGFHPHAQTQPATPGCAQLQAAQGYSVSAGQSLGWGATLATPTSDAPAVGWGALGQRLDGGLYLCSNTNSPDPYLFQCTELVNRFDMEEWVLAHIAGSSGRYFDYYEGGVFHPGHARVLPANFVSFSDDASQGQSAFAPEPGDLLIFQDVNNAAVGWRSGLTSGTGHVALIV